MKTIDFSKHVGMRIERAAQFLVDHAPARGLFNGVEIRARYATTHPRDIVNEYHWQWTLRDIRYANSAKGKAERREREQEIARRQARVDDLIANLPIFGDPLSVVLWIRALSEAMNMVGVVVPSAQIERLFNDHGYWQGRCEGDDYRHDDIHNTSCYLAGQFLAILNGDRPGGGMFLVLCDRWIERWSPKD